MGAPLLAWLILLGAGCTKKGPEVPPRKKINIETWVIEPMDLNEEISLPGIVRADKEIRLSAEVAASVKKVHVDVGANLTEGQILVEFDDTDLLLVETQARSQVASLEARLRELKRGAREQQVREAEVVVNAAREGLELARTIVERRRKLSEEKVIPLEVLDQARIQLTEAQAAHDRAKEMLDLVREGATKEAEQALEAQLEGARAALGLASNRVKKAVVKSPLKGILIRRFVDEDEFTGPGERLFDVIPETPVVVSLGVPERIFGKLKKHDGVFVTFKVMGLSVPAKISTLAPAANPRSQTFQVEIDIANPVAVGEPVERGGPRRVAVRPGLIADVCFNLGVHEDALVIPNDALILAGEGFFVYVLEADRVKVRPVMIGLKKSGWIEVTEGLEEGERLVVEGQKQARDGDEVNLMKEHTGSLEALALE